MAEKKHASGIVAAGDLTQRVGVEQIRARGIDVDQLLELLIDAAGAEFTTYYYYTILRMSGESESAHRTTGRSMYEGRDRSSDVTIPWQHRSMGDCNRLE